MYLASGLLLAYYEVAAMRGTGDMPSVQGRNVVLESKYGSPRIVNDGVTVAKEVELEDPVENIGAKLVRQARTLRCIVLCLKQGKSSAQEKLWWHVA